MKGTSDKTSVSASECVRDDIDARDGDRVICGAWCDAACDICDAQCDGVAACDAITCRGTVVEISDTA